MKGPFTYNTNLADSYCDSQTSILEKESKLSDRKKKNFQTVQTFVLYTCLTPGVNVDYDVEFPCFVTQLKSSKSSSSDFLIHVFHLWTPNEQEMFSSLRAQLSYRPVTHKHPASKKLYLVLIAANHRAGRTGHSLISQYHRADKNLMCLAG